MTNTTSTTKSLFLSTILLALMGCNTYQTSTPSACETDVEPEPYCFELPTLQTEVELRTDMELCPYVTSQYQALLFDLDSDLYQGPGCFEDAGCPDVQVACPFAMNGGEANCEPEDVAQCADWFRQMRESHPEDFSMEDIRFHLDCECHCQ